MRSTASHELRALQTADWDMVVVGAGCAGMATALFASLEGLRVIVLERSQWVGGTSALAAGALWIPNTHLAEGSGDTPQKVARYLEQACPDVGSQALRTRFLALGPDAVKRLEAHTEVRMRAFSHHPDYLSDLEGASIRGRVLECLPFDGRRLGDDLSLVRPPIPEFTVLGGMMVDRIDIGHLLNLGRSLPSFLHASRLLLRYAVDRMRGRRGSRLVMGNALVGRLLFSLRQRGVPIVTGTAVERLVTREGRVIGVELHGPAGPRLLTARRGVVLAGGGFNDHPNFRKRLIPDEAAHSPRALSSPGLLLQQALDLGARLEPDAESAAFWAPVSIRRRPDGSQAVFPHLIFDRAKPGTVVVNRRGRRFVNESCTYHLFGERMLRRDNSGERPDAVAFLIADRRALVRYGLGILRPGARGLAGFLREGYIVEAPTIAGLAERLGIDGAALQETIERLNRFAHTGIDEDFHRGSTAYQRNLGDPTVQPNPTLGAIDEPPFYAVTIYPGDIGAITGLATDADARVLRGDVPIEGLFAVGNDMQSIMGGAYPGPGINLGPAVVFAYAAARAAAAATPVPALEAEDRATGTATAGGTVG
jgi:hypothetical protein